MLQSFRTMLGRLQEMWQKIKSQPLWLGVFALTIAGVFFLVEPTLAQEGVATGVGDWLIRQVAKIMLVIASLAIGLSIFFLRFFIMIASYNNYIDVSVVQLGWVMVRDVANMFFVVALLLIAFGTILGLEEYEWKKNLAKLVLSAILINFSNLIAQLCIDIAHIFTITFLNAISATAGGNLINMFKLDQILQLTAAQDPSGLDIEVLAAVLPAMLFAIMAAAAIGSYVVVMAGRVVALWALIVISPLAFILGVIPQTKSYAEKWWSEFTKYVIVAPIMVFFLWLSFATIGLGSIATEIEADLPATVRTAGAEAQFGVQRLSMSKVTSWENMANFLIAFAFLMYGIKATQETGVVGSGMIGSAVDFGKKVATIASGYAAGRWLVDKGKSGVVEGAKWTGDALVGDYVEQIGNKLKKIPEGYRNWRSAGPQIERDEQTLTEEKLIDPNYQLTEADKKAGFTLENRADGVYKVQGLSEVEMAKGYEIVESKDEKTGKITRSKVYDGYKKNIKTDAQGNVVYKKDDKGNYVTDNQGRRVAVGADKPLYESKLQELVNRRYQSLLSSRKRLEKVQNDTKLNEEMMDKSIEAQPTHWLGSKNPAQAKDFDRIKRGMLAAMEARSSAKTQEFSTLGEKIVKGSKRFKDGKFQTERGTIAEQIAEHEAKSSQRQSELDLIAKAARTQVLGSDVGKKAFEGKIKADLRVKEEGTNISNLEAGMTTGVTLATVAATEAANEVVRKYKTDFDQAQNAGDFAEQDKILRKMMADGLIGKAEFDELNRNQEINRQMNSYSNLPDKDAALNQLVADGTISAKEKEKYSKLMGNSRQLSGVFPSEKSNILQRTIAAEKEAHLQAERLSTVQKEEEGKFAEDEHGKQEAREIALLKERAAAAQAKIDQSDETGKADVATSALPGDTPELVAQKAAFAKIRAERIAAQKAAHTEGQKVSTEEKEAEKVYAESTHGAAELRTEEELKERTAAADARIKELTAQAKKDMQEKPEFAEKQKERIAAEQKAASLETQAQKFEKERVADFVAGVEGQAAKVAETLAKEQIAAADARTKQAESEAKATLSETYDPEFVAAQAAKIEAERMATAKAGIADAYESKVARDFATSDAGKNLSLEEVKAKATKAAAEAEISEVQTESERQYRDDFMAKYLNRIAAARNKIMSKDSAVQAEGESEYDEIWKKIESDQNPLAQKLAAEKRAHTATNQTQRFDKSLEELYAGSEEGKHELELDSKFAAQKALSEQELKRREAVAKKSFLKSTSGKTLSETNKKSDLLTQVQDAQIKQLDAVAVKKAGEALEKAFTKINLAEQGVVAAQEFIKTLKTNKLREAFSDAAKEMARIIKSESKDRSKMSAELKKAADKNKFIEVLASSVKQKEATDSLRYQQTLATEAASAGFYEIPQFGRSTPSQAVDPMVAEAGKALKSMEAADGAGMVARQLGSILRQRKSGKISDQQRATLFAAVSHITNEAWTDDTLAEIAALFQDLDNGKIDSNSDDGRDIEQLRDVFVNQLGLMKKKDDGEYVSYSTPKDAAALQALVVMGGDMDFVRAHNKVSAATDGLNDMRIKPDEDEDLTEFTVRQQQVKEKVKAEMKRSGLTDSEVNEMIKFFETNGGKAVSYEQIAKKMSDTGLLKNQKIENFDKFDQQLESKQDILQEASAVFKRAALNTKHTQNGAHQAHDARWRGEGRYRLMTGNESAAIMTAEGVKRSGLESSQYHSVGTVDNSISRLVEISEKMFPVIFGQMRDSVKAGAVLQRTLDQVMGYKAGAKKKTGEVLDENGQKTEGLFKIGGDIKDMAELMGIDPNNIEEARQAYFDKMIAPMLRGDPQAFQLLVSKKSGVNNNLDANAGVINSMIDLGEGKEIGGKKFTDLLKGFLKADTEHTLKIDSQTKKHIQKLIKVYQLKEREIGGGRGRAADEAAQGGSGE